MIGNYRAAISLGECVPDWLESQVRHLARKIVPELCRGGAAHEPHPFWLT